jgi:hypothetical protein
MADDYSNHTVQWFFDRVNTHWSRTQPAGELYLESQNPGDGRKYWITKDDSTISPKLSSREMKIWLDAYLDGMRLGRFGQ